MKKCLIVVDYQVDFVTGSLGFEGALQLENKIAEKINACRNSGYTIIFTFDTHTADYLKTNEGKHLPIPHCILGTPGHELFGKVKLATTEDDIKIYKPTFGSGELYEYLKAEGFDKVEFVGVVTDICVLSNAVLAKTALPEARVEVHCDMVATPKNEVRDAAFTVLSSLQVELINREKI